MCSLYRDMIFFFIDVLVTIQSLGSMQLFGISVPYTSMPLPRIERCYTGTLYASITNLSNAYTGEE